MRLADWKFDKESKLKDLTDRTEFSEDDEDTDDTPEAKDVLDDEADIRPPPPLKLVADADWCIND